MTEDRGFPGRWVGGTALILGPLLLLTGTLLRAPFPFFFPHQIAAATAHPVLMTAAYSAFLAGNVLMGPAVVTLARNIGLRRPAWAAWGGTLVVVGLFERTFHAGIDHAAFTVVRHRGPEAATGFVTDLYQDLHLFSFLSFTIMFGWYVLAIGAYLSGALGRIRSIALATMGLLPLGVLKGTEIVSIIGTTGLVVALLPAGVRLLRGGPRPSRKAILLTGPAVLGLAALGYVSTLG
ncbi:hypothetical protein [Amycolatopsis rifamycinica]|uniref:DUF4386 family protein n=1 Tax=Amycolatopsis rifamycinica TaxID=287986 RepID=A0A066UDC5_9PSEU|nr:hypothetical protein [Amycolatopsis rifamycinica]KDN22139.1 hypothetical protein DV20_12215 [Amycolatopsis rifamycinica]